VEQFVMILKKIVVLVMMISNLLIITRITGLLLVAQLFTSSIFSQENLLLNGSFEELSVRDFSKATIDGQPLYYPKKDTALLWHMIDRDDISVSSTRWNYSTDSMPKSNTWYSEEGEAHSGYVYNKITPFYVTLKESGVYYVQNTVGEFCKPLIKDNIYELSLWIRPFKGNYYINSIDIHFDSIQHYFDGYVRYREREKKEREQPDWIQTQNFTPTVLSQDCVIDLPSEDDKKYVQVSCQYKAKGGEKYVYIGNLDYDVPRKFKKKDLKTYNQPPIPVPTCVYAIDDVSLISKTDTTEKCNMKPLTNKVNIPYKESPASGFIDEFVLKDSDFKDYDLKVTQKTNLQTKFEAIDFESVKYVIITECHDKLTGFSVKDMPLKYSPAIKKFLLSSSQKIKIYTRGKLKEQSDDDRVKIQIYYQ